MLFLGFPQVLKLYPQGSAAPCQQRFKGFNANAKNIRRFDIAAVLKVTELDRRPLAFRKRPERRFNLLRKLRIFEVGSWSGRRIDDVQCLLEPRRRSPARTRTRRSRSLRAAPSDPRAA